MLCRHNSMTSIHHQPIMPFKWRPFDLYNDIHVNETPVPPPPSPSPSQHNTNVCEQLTASNCVQCYQCEFNNHHHHMMMCDGSVKEHHRQRHRQSSRGSSSGGGSGSGSCASISTIGRYFVNDIDNSESNMDTIISCGSIDCFCCQLDGQRMTTTHNGKMSYNGKQQRPTNCSICLNEITISKCCIPNCQNISSKHTTIMNNKNNNEMNTKSLVNRVVVMPFDGIDYTYKCEQSMIGTLNHCESPSMTNTTMPTVKISTTKSNENIDCTTFDHCMDMNHCCHAGYFDNNWMIVHKKRPNTDSSKYIFL